LRQTILNPSVNSLQNVHSYVQIKDKPSRFNDFLCFSEAAFISIIATKIVIIVLFHLNASLKFS